MGRKRYPKEYHEHARAKIFDYVEGFYNSHRQHSALGHVSQIDYEARVNQEVR